jgi:hypothetical protein
MAKRVQWDFKVALPALGITGISAEPTLYAQGSHADIYQHPSNPHLLIKVTNDDEDVRNTVAAQVFNRPNIVRCHAQTTSGVQHGTALLVDLVRGAPAPYSSAEFAGLMEGQQGNEPRHEAPLRILRPDQFRTGILQSHGRLNRQELLKLSELFGTLIQLERVGVFLIDLSENVIDAGADYVIVDFGR